MKNKLKLILFSLSFMLFAALTVIGFMAISGNAAKHLAVLPKVAGNKSVSIDDAEEVNENIMLTYESIYEKNVKALQVNRGVTLTATNYTYPYVMGFTITSGGFFSKEAQDNGNKAAVLNEKAAFDLFGTLEPAGNELYIDMKPYLVIGVVNDGDEDNLNVFVPVSGLDDSFAESLVVSLEGVIEEHVKNELKSAGVNDMKFDFLNLALISKTVWDKVFLSAAIAFMGFLLIILKKSVLFLAGGWTDFKRLRQQVYVRGILIDKSGIVYKLTASAAFIILVVAAELWLLLYSVEKLLIINNLAGVFDGIVFAGFAAEISYVRNLYLLSNILFIAFAAVFTSFTAVALSGKE